MALITISTNKKIIVSIILVPVIILGYYLAIYQSYRYQSANNTTGSSMVIISLIGYSMLWLNINYKSKKQSVPNIILTVVISIAIIITFMVLKSNYETEQIDKKPEHAIAHVTGFEIEKSLRGRESQYATIEYKYSDKVVVQRISDYDETYKIGDTLKVKFSGVYPEMFKVEN
jgi:hypothetical protein